MSKICIGTALKLLFLDHGSDLALAGCAFVACYLRSTATDCVQWARPDAKIAAVPSTSISYMKKRKGQG